MAAMAIILVVPHLESQMKNGVDSIYDKLITTRQLQHLLQLRSKLSCSGR